ncbi:MAG TPA: MoaF N-terminal domain-containing protein [Candidatus Dormibacteraeota bacterium]|nr:MoaF N-terminal domain-containing protein [Candidatus Dormibacteraeota bacterium]
MPGTPYPKEQMHRIAYTKLTKEQISEKLSAVSGPTSASPLSDVFAGKSIRIVTDNGPTLSYTFNGNKQLSLTDGNSSAVNAGYGAFTLDSIVFFSHMIPNTVRGYAVAIDRSTNLATVFDLWFCGYKDNREVQREIYYGYVEQPGQDAPKARHATTDRMEGKGFYWKQDAGAETLELYPSTSYSNFVELSRLGGELSFCAPSDYVKIDENHYIYTRTECEFSGTFTGYVMDLNRIEQVGTRLGFKANDELEYYVFRGNGKWLGQFARFEKLGDERGAEPPAPAPGKPAVKGARRVYRPFETMPKMTRADVDAVCAKSSTAFEAPSGPARAGGAGAGMAGNLGPNSGWLAGKELTLRYDTLPAMEYRFEDAETLHYRKGGRAEWIKARYHAYESCPGVFLFGHLLQDEPNHDGHMVVADFDQGLVTCFNGYLNTPYFANEAGVKIHFGVIEMDGLIPPKYRRHELTDEMVGRSITQNYSPGLTSMHVYTTPHSLSWVIFTDTDSGGLEWSGPAGYVKIRDGLYFMYWLEEACNGTLGTILVNLKAMRDVGIGYVCGARGLNMGAIGAHERLVGRLDVVPFYRVRESGRLE